MKIRFRNTFFLFFAFIYWAPINAEDHYSFSQSEYSGDEVISEVNVCLKSDTSIQLYHRIPAEVVHALSQHFYASGKTQIKKNIFPQLEVRFSAIEMVLHYLIHSKILMIKFQKKDIIFPFHVFW